MSDKSQHNPKGKDPERQWVEDILDGALRSSSEIDALRRVQNRLKPILIYDWHEPREPRELEAVSEFTERLSRVYEGERKGNSGSLSYKIEAPIVHKATFPESGICYQVAGLFQAQDKNGLWRAFADGAPLQQPSVFVSSRYGLGELVISYDAASFSRSIAYSEDSLHDEISQFAHSQSSEPMWLRSAIARFCFEQNLDLKALLFDRDGRGGEILAGSGKFIPFRASLSDEGVPAITRPQRL